MDAHFTVPSALQGNLHVPGSKSYTHRAYLTAALHRGGRVVHPLRSDDTDATRDCLRGLSGGVQVDTESVEIDALDSPRVRWDQFEVRESGTLLRFLIPICSMLPGLDRVVLRGDGSLQSRSNRGVLESVRDNGFRVEGTGPEETVPITCYPSQSPGHEEIVADTHTTSQLLSGWLLAVSSMGGGTVKRRGPLVSAPYVRMTERVLEAAGVRVQHPAPDQYRIDSGELRSLNYTVPGDFSSAAFFVVGGALTEGSLRLLGLDPEDPQGDRRIVEILQDLDARVSWSSSSSGEELVVEGPFRPPGFELDASDCPDLVPILCVLGGFARGRVTLRNIGHLTNKESNRIDATCRELNKCGMELEPYEDRIRIDPVPESQLTPAVLDPHRDHRLAMSFSILGVLTGQVTVQDVGCIGKSYPEFLPDLRSVGGVVELGGES